MIPINLVVEDLLTKAIANSILSGSEKQFHIHTVYDDGGFGYIKSKIKGFNSAAKGCPFLVITDLDRNECAVSLIEEWLGETAKHTNLIFRIAVHEVESWILADREKFAEFLGIRVDLIPDDTDTIEDPKDSLIKLAGQSRYRSLKERIVPDESSGAKQGPDYNGALAEFVQKKWRVSEATKHSPSLKRAFERITNFEPVWPQVNTAQP